MEKGELIVSESQWQKKGATLSHKKACKEFGLTEDEVIKAIVGKKTEKSALLSFRD